jgi:hypothetical protein
VISIFFSDPALASVNTSVQIYTQDCALTLTLVQVLALQTAPYNRNIAVNAEERYIMNCGLSAYCPLLSHSPD